MKYKNMLVCALLCVVSLWSQAQINLQPKYGGQTKNAAQLAADADFLASMDKMFDNDRAKAAEEVAARGWTLYRRGQQDDAMRRFNQAWLLNPENGSALWGMAAMEMSKERIASGRALFEEAARTMSQDIDFQADYARNKAELSESESDLEAVWLEFARIHAKAPNHTLNLQNWAISYFAVERYREAWEKILLAEKTPRARELDPRFIKALSDKMPRP
jgi:tetratricopeptide (TPR) repeat protein